MAFFKYATATTVQPSVSGHGWNKVRTASAEGGPSENLIHQASEILEENFDPKKYLLTHATIVCSVDTQSLDDPSVKIGSVLDPMTGKRINRKWANYRINPESDKFINSNNDAWSREVLMKSFRTFIGGHNFVEHCQKLEESKGRIIDAVARDIGPSTYIDILIATDRKHSALIRDIESGRTSTLSMGCSCTETICTKCGNVGADETELCNHIRLEKGNTFFDNKGQKHRIAELCGHHTLEPTGGVHFIEASWVATPAFGGAVMRNILTPNGIDPDVLKQAQDVLNTPPPQWTASGLPKAATVQVAEQIKPASYYGPDGPGHTMADSLMGFDDEDEDEAPAPKAPEKKPLDQLADDVYQQMIQRVNQRVRDEMKGPKPSVQEVAHSTGDDIIKQGFRKAAYKLGLTAIVRSASSDAHLMDSIAQFNADNGVKIPRALYRIALQLGPMSKYGSVESWAVQAHGSLHRTPTLDEIKTLLRLGSLLDQWSSFSSSSN